VPVRRNATTYIGSLQHSLPHRLNGASWPSRCGGARRIVRCPPDLHRARVYKRLCGWMWGIRTAGLARLSASRRQAPVQKTATHTDSRWSYRSAFTGTPIEVGAAERVGNSGEQTLAVPVFAGMHGSEKNHCLFVALHETLRRSKGSDPNRWPKQFQGQSWGQRRSRKPRCRIYLAFSCGEVAERLKAAVC
jgi:hypothetical protein